MVWLRRAALLASAVALAWTSLALADPSPPMAQANVACDLGVGAAEAVTGGVGIGDPVGDACNAVTDPAAGIPGHALDPLKDAATSIGQGVFDQITSWAAEGATWLLGRVVELTEKSTSPDLLDKGFLRSYGRMAQIAVVLAALMLIFATIESLGRGEPSMLIRVFLLNVPVAAIATSAAYVVVQLLVASTDGFCDLIAHASAADSRQFFKGAIEALAEAGADAGAASETAGLGRGATAAGGAAAVPVFVGFIVAILAAVAAFLVWVELLMRDAAIYAVALFMPLAIAASIWPRWTSALRRTAELIVVVVSSKFVIVSIIALAASLLAHAGGKVEHVLAAGALLLLACFSPLVLLRLVPFAEGALSAAHSRQSAGGAAVRTSEIASAHMMRRAALKHWAEGAARRGGVQGGGGQSAGGGRGGPGPGRGGAPPGGGGASGGGAGGASGGGAGAVALPAAAAIGTTKAAKAGAERLGAAAPTGAGEGSTAQPASGAGAQSAPRPEAGASRAADEQPRASQGGSSPEPNPAPGSRALDGAEKAPRPRADVGKAGPAPKGTT